MKVVYNPHYTTVYTYDPAAAKGRMESIMRELEGVFDFLTPEPARDDDVLLVHSPSHLEHIRSTGLIYEMACLAAGGAIKASELAVGREPSFAAIRPPGHHASPDNCWGFCFFNNIAIAVERLRRREEVGRVVIVDIDLHYGDGTANIFHDTPEVDYFHISGTSREDYVCSLEDFLHGRKADLIALSAGFDRHVEDWGGLLHTEDYCTIGKLVREFSNRVCSGRRFAVLEGGYNHDVLGRNVLALLEGMG